MPIGKLMLRYYNYKGGVTMYKVMRKGGVKRLEDKAFIPADPRNKDWREYQEWLKKGNNPEPPDPEPSKINHLQLKKDLINNINSASTLSEVRAIMVTILEKLL